MKQIIKLTESDIKNIVASVLLEAKILTEASSTVLYRNFKKTMEGLGFTCTTNDGSKKIFRGNSVTIRVDVHNDNLPVDPAALRDVKNKLNAVGWFNNYENFKKFPFEEWELKSDDVEPPISKEMQEIQAANELYKNATVEPVNNEQNETFAYLLRDASGMVNLCKGPDDRRPLLDDWYDRFEYNRYNTYDVNKAHFYKAGSIPCLKKDNYETCETECYPIKSDGKNLEKTNIIIENKIYGKSGNKMAAKRFL